MMKLKKSKYSPLKDFVFFPLRTLLLIEESKWGLTSLRDERFHYVKKYAIGRCLDIGCGKNNIFIKQFLNNNGVGLDIFPYEGLTDENLVDNFREFPFPQNSFDTVTFIANFNHIPKDLRDIEISEAYRVLKIGGRIIITMGSPIAELLAHLNVWLQDNLFGTNFDMDSERGMAEGENYFVLDKEIKECLNHSGFTDLQRHYFPTQWWLNHLWIGCKEK
ncbi:MAG: class I SAM-dependent methyltransferase [Anaerolineaceae bacterium]